LTARLVETLFTEDAAAFLVIGLVDLATSVAFLEDIERSPAGWWSGAMP